MQNTTRAPDVAATDRDLTSSDWVDSIRWWLDHLEDAQQQGVSLRTIMLCIRAAADKAIQCEEAQA